MHQRTRNAMFALAALALIVTSAIAQVGGNGTRVGQFTGQRIAGVSITDTTTRVLRVDASGNLNIAEGSKDRDYGTIISSGLGTINSLAAGTAVVSPTAVDISTYSRITLLLTWNFAAAADSDSVNVCVNLYGKTASNMSDGINNQLFIRLPSQGVSATATTDTARVWFPTGVSTLASKGVPTMYITRNGTTGVNYTGVAYNHSASWIAAMQPRWFWTGVGSCAISLDNIPGLGAYPYLGISVANVNVTKAITSVTASYWVSR